MTHLCAPIVVHTIEQALAEAAQAAEMGADLVEFRIDMVSNEQIVRDVVRRSSIPCIVTCRPSWEGGDSEYPDEYRFTLLAAALDAGAAFVDIESKVIRNAPPIFEMNTSRVIVSRHDFTGRPAKLYNLMDELANAPATKRKIAWMARSIRDNLEAFEIVEAQRTRVTALCMGEAGLSSRVLAKKFGAFLTFASLRPTEATAPGQTTLDEMKRLYRWDAINERTKVFGVVGSPIAHSMSPAIHNAAFESMAFDGVYLPMLVEPSYESFKAFMESFLAFDPLDLTGLSITIPHKENALRYLQSKGAHIDELSKRIGAINTIKVSGGAPRVLHGFNTDYDSILDSITDTLKISREQLSDYRVAIIGAGGTARTAVAALAKYGATLVVYNRTRERAEALASEFNGKNGRVVGARFEKLCDSCCHLFINCTPVGMHPNIDASPIDGQSVQFTPEQLVFDTIYNPAETKLLRTAHEHGAKTIAGEEMFIRQAAAQFRGFTGIEPPVQVMRNALRARLAQFAGITSE